ncbi:hypothetical protein BDF20DRAFT_900707 [Mycotypha africana]|uniref:uncharacterized protein n=1 Tax=Mycotypha africana TaxID=64632 RepID=UPI002301ADB3|nr:uncharacterized protein BDF20DRAFT_900707 [Mycotypha africana]KAI8967371.1 hypothetical protein BDF20DRAFT_900707 [Mycotypha africana]
MGASVSKHGHDKRSTKIKVGPYDAATTVKLHNEKRRHKFHKRNKTNKKGSLNELIIGNPTDFVHLNHAGMDGISNMDKLFIPIEEAQQREKFNNATTRTTFMSRSQCDNSLVMNTNHTLPTCNNIRFNDIMHFNKLHLSLITSRNDINGFGSEEQAKSVDIKFYGAGSPLKHKPINYSMFAHDENSAIIEERAPSNIIAPVAAFH